MWWCQTSMWSWGGGGGGEKERNACNNKLVTFLRCLSPWIRRVLWKESLCRQQDTLGEKIDFPQAEVAVALPCTALAPAPHNGMWSCRGDQGSKLGWSWNGDFAQAVHPFPSVLFVMQHRAIIQCRLRRETRRAAWKCVAVWKFQHFHSWKWVGKAVSASLLPNCKIIYILKFFEHEGKTKTTKQTKPLIPPTSLSSFFQNGI